MNKLYMKTLRQCALIAITLLISQVSFAQNDDQVSVNFRNADINSLIESVSEITGRTFIVDPRVSGQITIISNDTMDADMFYEAFLSALQVQNFQAVDDGAVTRIVPFNSAFGFLGTGGANEIETRLIKVENVDAASLVPVVKPLLSAASRLQAFSESNFLVVTDIRSNVQELVAIVAEMDDPSNNTLEVISLENISAGEAVHIVGQLNLQQQGLSVVEDSLNNRLIISGPNSARASFRTMLRTLDVPTTRAGGVEVVHLDFARAEDIKPILDGMLASDMFLLVAGEGGGGGEGAAANSSYRVEIDASSNALVIAASPAVIRELRNVIQQLDTSRPQVLIEAVIAELSEDQANRLSSQLVLVDENSGGYLSKFDNVLTTILGTLSDGSFTGGDVTQIGQVIGDTSNAYFVGGDIDRENGRGMGIIIQALKTDSRTRVLSTPSVVTLDNREASLSVGQEVPFITGSFTSTSNASTNPFQTIDRQEVGIKLVVTPQISKGDAVRLDLYQESSKLLNNSSQLGTADVVTSISTITTNVLVQDGDMLILGGLNETQFDNQQTKVPLLGDIPLLGALFRSSAKGDGDRVLMMFIRPTILRNSATANTVSRQRFDHLITLDADDEDNPGIIGDRLEEFRNQPRPESGIEPAQGIQVIPGEPSQPSSSIMPSSETPSSETPSSETTSSITPSATTVPAPVVSAVPVPVSSASASTRSTSTDSTNLAGSWSVRLGVFGEERNAQALESRLQTLSYQSYIQPFQSTRDYMAAVYVGPVATRQDASDLVVELRSAVGIEGVVQANQ